MWVLSWISLFWISIAGATSLKPATTAQSAPGSASHCELLARFTGESADAPSGAVHWDFAVIQARSIGAGVCPPGGSFSLRVRGAEHVSHPHPEFIYPTHVARSLPEVGSEVRLRVRASEGVDSHTRRAFSEWILVNWSDGISSSH